jgi:hypothetical protein
MLEQTQLADRQCWGLAWQETPVLPGKSINCSDFPRGLPVIESCPVVPYQLRVLKD